MRVWNAHSIHGRRAVEKRCNLMSGQSRYRRDRLSHIHLHKISIRRNYCERQGDCNEKRMVVKNPRMSLAWRIPSRARGIQLKWHVESTGVFETVLQVIEFLPELLWDCGRRWHLTFQTIGVTVDKFIFFFIVRIDQHVQFAHRCTARACAQLPFFRLSILPRQAHHDYVTQYL